MEAKAEKRTNTSNVWEDSLQCSLLQSPARIKISFDIVKATDWQKMD